MESSRFIAEQLWRRLVSKIIDSREFQERFGDGNTETQQDWAERVMDQAIGFLRLCAVEPDGAYGPSTLVDIGWHVFILHTREYADFCARIAGSFIHHCPIDESTLGGTRGSIEGTVAALRVRGINVDESLWFDLADCGGKKCYSDCNKEIF